MNSRPPPLPLPPSSLPSLPPLPPLQDRPPIARRLDGALDAALRRRRGRLDRLELALSHAIAPGAGWTTEWHLRARVTDMRGSAATRVQAPASALRPLDRGELPAGQPPDMLWRWVADTSALHRLASPLLTEKVLFADAAEAATLEVLRHRVLRSATVLECLPASLTVALGQRREAGASPAAPAPAPVPVARLIATFPGRAGAHCDTRVVVWDSARRPGLVELLRDCARQLASEAPPQAPLSAPPADRTSTRGPVARRPRAHPASVPPEP